MDFSKPNITQTRANVLASTRDGVSSAMKWGEGVTYEGSIPPGSKLWEENQPPKKWNGAQWVEFLTPFFKKSELQATTGATQIGTTLATFNSLADVLSRVTVSYRETGDTTIANLDLNTAHTRLPEGWFTYAHGNAPNTNGPVGGPGYGRFYNGIGTSCLMQMIVSDNPQVIYFRCTFNQTPTGWNGVPWVRLSNEAEIASLQSQITAAAIKSRFNATGGSTVGNSGTVVGYTNTTDPLVFNVATGEFTAARNCWVQVFARWSHGSVIGGNGMNLYLKAVTGDITTIAFEVLFNGSYAFRETVSMSTGEKLFLSATGQAQNVRFQVVEF